MARHSMRRKRRHRGVCQRAGRVCGKIHTDNYDWRRFGPEPRAGSFVAPELGQVLLRPLLQRGSFA